jgi:hypothetical protein
VWASRVPFDTPDRTNSTTRYQVSTQDGGHIEAGTTRLECLSIIVTLCHINDFLCDTPAERQPHPVPGHGKVGSPANPVKVRRAEPAPVPCGASSVRTEDTSAEERQLRSPISGPFDQFGSGDVALDRPCVPRIPKGVGDRLQVVGHAGCQPRERLQVAGCSVKQPLL